jgi:hypothetical protein
MKLSIRLLTATGLLAAALPGSTILIDFEDLTWTSAPNPNWQYFYGDSVVSRGYQFQALGAPDPSIALSSHAAAATGYTGTAQNPNTALFGTYTGKQFRMTKGGAAFNVSSIGLAHLYRFNYPTFGITFVGTRADASTVTETINVSNMTALTSYSFANMTNIVKMEWRQGSGYPDIHQFDNINATAVVPEPFTMTLAIGAAAAGFRRVRRRRNAMS